MPRPTIQLLVFEGCPLAAAARQSLRQALDELDLPTFEEIDILDAAVPEELRAWGSPTILIDGEDVSGSPKGNSVACRVYAEPNGVPTPATIAACIRAKSDLAG
jgi:mercuric ion transport protein